MYERGIGVTKDPTKGVTWLGRAAELGYAPAALNLGQAYWKGLGVKPDLVTAYMWRWLAANSKVPGAEQDEQELRKELPPKKVNQAKQKATEWLVKHPIVGLRQR
jgi:TPR repeat protein